MAVLLAAQFFPVYVHFVHPHAGNKERGRVLLCSWNCPGACVPLKTSTTAVWGDFGCVLGRGLRFEPFRVWKREHFSGAPCTIITQTSGAPSNLTGCRHNREPAHTPTHTVETRGLDCTWHWMRPSKKHQPWGRGSGRGALGIAVQAIQPEIRLIIRIHMPCAPYGAQTRPTTGPNGR